MCHRKNRGCFWTIFGTTSTRLSEQNVIYCSDRQNSLHTLSHKSQRLIDFFFFRKCMSNSGNCAPKERIASSMMPIFKEEARLAVSIPTNAVSIPNLLASATNAFSCSSSNKFFCTLVGVPKMQQRHYKNIIIKEGSGWCLRMETTASVATSRNAQHFAATPMLQSYFPTVALPESSNVPSISYVP